MKKREGQLDTIDFEYGTIEIEDINWHRGIIPCPNGYIYIDDSVYSEVKEKIFETLKRYNISDDLYRAVVNVLSDFWHFWEYNWRYNIKFTSSYIEFLYPGSSGYGFHILVKYPEADGTEIEYAILDYGDEEDKESLENATDDEKNALKVAIEDAIEYFCGRVGAAEDVLYRYSKRLKEESLEEYEDIQDESEEDDDEGFLRKQGSNKKEVEIWILESPDSWSPEEISNIDWDAIEEHLNKLGIDVYRTSETKDTGFGQERRWIVKYNDSDFEDNIEFENWFSDEVFEYMRDFTKDNNKKPKMAKKFSVKETKKIVGSKKPIWVDREIIAQICPECARMMKKQGIKKLNVRPILTAKWKSLPRGWTEKSLRSFWNSIGGSVSECIEKMEGRVSDPATFCAALKDRIEGTTYWRGPEKKKTMLKLAGRTSNLYQKQGGELTPLNIVPERKIIIYPVALAAEDVLRVLRYMKGSLTPKQAYEYVIYHIPNVTPEFEEDLKAELLKYGLKIED